MLSFIPDDSSTPPEVKALYPAIRKRIHEDLEEQTDDPLYNAPFRLMHGNFDGHNMLFTWPNKNVAQKLSAIVDWDYSYAGPLYYLYDYPAFVQDDECSDDDVAKWSQNKHLRKRLVSALLHSFPKGSEDRLDVRECFRQKSYMYNVFETVFMYVRLRGGRELAAVRRYKNGICGGTQERDFFPYNGRCEWTPGSRPESDDEG